MISVILKTCFIYITFILYTDAIKELRDRILLYSKRPDVDDDVSSISEGMFECF